MQLSTKITFYSIGIIMITSQLFAQKQYEISNLSFNTTSGELAPSFYKGGLVFCSDRRHDIVMSYTDLYDNPLTNLYFSELKKSGKFESPRLFSKELTTYLFEGPAAFSKDGKTIFFTRSIDVSRSMRNQQRADTTFGIFTSELNNGRWINISGFRYNSEAYNTGYPSLSEDGKRLYFCMDAPGGYGGFDIYVSELRNGQWNQPENLGNLVNSDKNDVFPFYHKSGRLYFASRGHGQGDDLDIYYTVEMNGIWQKPVSLAEPINSGKDDYGLIMNGSIDSCYFVSDREGSADIYAAYSVYPTFVNCPVQEDNDYCFVFYEPNNNEVDTIAYAYEWDLGDGTLIRSLEAEHCFSGPGSYTVQLNLVDKLTNEVLLAQASYDFLVEPVEQAFITAPDTVNTGTSLNFSGRETFLKNFNISNYYWDFDDGFQESGIEAMHSFVFPGNYMLKLGVLQKSTERNVPDELRCVTRRIVVIP